jgi:hypothetical protein
LIITDVSRSLDAALFFQPPSLTLLDVLLWCYAARKCSVVGHLIVGIGCQCFALANSYGGFLVATILITFGGPGIQLSIVHLCSLFPKNQYFALCSINGSISFSFIVFVAFAAIWEATKVSFRTLFQVQALIIFASMLVSWMVWPDKPYKLPPATDNHEMTLEDQLVEAFTTHGHLFTEQSLDSFLREGDKQLQRHDSFIESKNALARGEDLLVDLKDMPFWKQLGSGTYLRAVFTFLTSCFMANFYVASISTEVSNRGGTAAVPDDLTGQIPFLNSFHSLLLACRFRRVHDCRTARIDADLHLDHVRRRGCFAPGRVANGPSRLGSLHGRDARTWANPSHCIGMVGQSTLLSGRQVSQSVICS